MMATKLITALIAGMFFTFFLDFFFILGLFLNYIQAQGIDVYYNVLFADHQSFLLFVVGVLFFGYLFVFFKNMKVSSIIFVLSLIAVNLTQIPDVGKWVGEMIFMQENQVLTEGKHTYIGKVIYEGRQSLWFYDEELQEILQLPKTKKDMNE